MLERSEGKTVSPARRRSRESGIEFGDIVGQAELKESLLAIGANDALDGLLIRGEKGTAKSTAVRALADLLPTQRAIEDCPYGCPPDPPEKQCVRCRERTASPTADPPIVERSVPLVTLPLGATRERVVGTLSVADALEGEYEFDPGVLARANRGLLYVDEINLLEDHLVDVLLDAAASGVNEVERDGVSTTHPARFTLVGTMNPEEGELRPQLRDRFALSTTVTGCEDVDQRVAIVERALGGRAIGDTGGEGERDRNGDAAGEGREAGSEKAAGPAVRLRRARELLEEVTLSTEDLASIAECCRDAGVEGHRGDIATARASRTLAALDGRRAVSEADLRQGAELALAHRLRSRPFEDAPDPSEVLDDHFEDDEGTSESPAEGGEAENEGEPEDGSKGNASDEERGGGDADGERAGGASESGNEGEGDSERGENDRDATGAADPAGENDTEAETEGSERGTGPTSEGSDTAAEASGAGDDGDERVPGDDANGPKEEGSGDDGGREEGGEVEPAERTPLVPGQAPAGVGEARAPDLDVPDAVENRGESEDGLGTGTHASANPSVEKAGPRVRTERATSMDDGIDAAASIRAAGARGASQVESRDLRRSVRQGEASTLVLFVVDASASMRPAMRAAKGVVLELLEDAYQGREEVGFVAFAGESGEVLLPPTDSTMLAARHLKELPTGDRTPLPAGLDVASDVLERAAPAASVVVLVTDGRANVAAGSPVERTRAAARRVGERASDVMIVDAGEDDRIGVLETIVEATGGRRLDLAALSAERVEAATDTAQESEL